MLYHVVAMARNRVIGKQNRIPWHFPSDLKHFKKLTLGGTVIMGRKTYESIGRALPGRVNMVLSRSPAGRTSAKGDGGKVLFFASLKEALENVKTDHAYIIGGAEVYAQTLPCIDGIYATCIDAEYEGDAFYPAIPAVFVEKSRVSLQKNPDLCVVFYEKRDMI